MDPKTFFLAFGLLASAINAWPQVPASTSSLAALNPGKDWIEVRFLEQDQKKILYYSLKIGSQTPDGSSIFPLYSMDKEGPDAFVPKPTDYTFELPNNTKKGLLVMKNGSAFAARAYIALDLGKLLTITDEAEKPAQPDTAAVPIATAPIAVAPIAAAPASATPPPVIPMMPSLVSAKPGTPLAHSTAPPAVKPVKSKPATAARPPASAPTPKTINAATAVQEITAPVNPQIAASSANAINNEPPQPPAERDLFGKITGGSTGIALLLLLLLALWLFWRFLTRPRKRRRAP